MNETSRRINAVLAMRGLSQAELARRMGTSQANVSRWAAGKMALSRVALNRMSLVLQVEPGELTGEYPLMTDDERELLRLFRHTSDEQKSVVMQLARALSNKPTATQAGDEDTSENK